MTSSSTTGSSNHNELSSFYAAFRADDTLIDIIPAFDYNHNTNQFSSNSRNRASKSRDDELSNIFQSTLSATSIFGGNVKAGLTYTVPVWMAMLLQQRSFATIVYPTDTWYNIPNLKYILSYEKTNVSLFLTTNTTDTNDATTSKSRRNHNDSDNDDDDDDNQDDTAVRQAPNSSSEYFLPSNYFELAMRFKASVSTSSIANTTSAAAAATTSTVANTSNNIDVFTLLIQDIYDIRMDKLRQQFQTLLYNTTKQPLTPHQPPTSTSQHTRTRATDMIINVTGIGTQELAQIQSYVLQAMNDIYYLES